MRDPLIRAVLIKPLANVLTFIIRTKTTNLEVVLSLDLSLQHLELLEYLRICLIQVHEHHSRVVVDKVTMYLDPPFDANFIGNITSL